MVPSIHETLGLISSMEGRMGRKEGGEEGRGGKEHGREEKNQMGGERKTGGKRKGGR